MSQPNKPQKIKLKLPLNRLGSNGLGSNPSPTSTPTTASPSAATPSSATPQRRLTLKVGGSKASTPVEPSAPTLQKASPQKAKKEQRARKPSAKILAAAKHDRSDDEDEAPPAKKTKKPSIKINFGRSTPLTPVDPKKVKLKVKGKPPKRPHGEGYDSEASDQEEDPAIEEQFTMRFDEKSISQYQPGADCSDDCAYIRQMIEERRIGNPDVRIYLKFYHPDGRRAAVTVRNNHYAATLVDMPTVVESMKSFDRKAWMKTADISQMLLVFAKITYPEVAKTIDLPGIIDRKTFEFPHGLTPPMRYARHRMFRPRTRRNDIEELEREVDALLARDEAAESTSYELFDPDASSRDQSRAFTEDVDEGGYVDNQQFEDENEDAEGEVDDSYEAVAPFEQGENEGEGDLEEQLALEMMVSPKDQENLGTPDAEAATPMNEPEEGSTPVGAGNESEEDSGDDDDDDEDEEDDDGEEEMDEETRARQAAIAEQREDIAEMEKSLEELQKQYHEMQNPILRKRLETSINNTRMELSLKKAAIEDVDDN